MLDIEFYGLIIALGILLAMLLVGVFCISINIDNIRLHKKYKGDESMRDFVNRETVKGLILILLEVFLACALLLVKMKMFS